MDSLVTFAMKLLGIKETRITETKKLVTQMDEQQLTLLQQHEAITEAARKLMDIAEKIFSDFESCPSWEDVDKYWKATELAEHVTRNL